MPSLPVAPGGVYTTTTAPLATGLVGTVGYRVEKPDGTIVTARTTAGISELPAGSGIYVATPTASNTLGDYIIVWDTGGVSPIYGVDGFTVTATGTLQLTTSDIVNALFDAAITGHNVANSLAAVIAAINAKDPLALQVPGNYTSGSAGQALARIASGAVATTPVVSPTGSLISLIIGDDYFNTDGRAITLTDNGGNWPDLTGAVVTFRVMEMTNNVEVISVAATVDTASGALKKVHVDLDAAHTGLLNPDRKFKYDMSAVLSNTHSVTLAIGFVKGSYRP